MNTHLCFQWLCLVRQNTFGKLEITFHPSSPDQKYFPATHFLPIWAIFFGNFAISCCSSSWDVAIFFGKFFLSCCLSSLNIAFFWVNFSLLAVRLVWILQYCQFPNLISLLYSSANSQMKLKLINIWNPNIWNPQMNLSTVELYFEMQRLQVCKARTRLQEIIGIDFYD